MLSVTQLQRLLLFFDRLSYHKTFDQLSTEFLREFHHELYVSSESINGNSSVTVLRQGTRFRILLASTLMTLLNDKWNTPQDNVKAPSTMLGAAQSVLQRHEDGPHGLTRRSSNGALEGNVASNSMRHSYQNSPNPPDATLCGTSLPREGSTNLGFFNLKQRLIALYLIYTLFARDPKTGVKTENDKIGGVGNKSGDADAHDRKESVGGDKKEKFEKSANDANLAQNINETGEIGDESNNPFLKSFMSIILESPQGHKIDYAKIISKSALNSSLRQSEANIEMKWNDCDLIKKALNEREREYMTFGYYVTNAADDCDERDQLEKEFDILNTFASNAANSSQGPGPSGSHASSHACHASHTSHASAPANVDATRVPLLSKYFAALSSMSCSDLIDASDSSQTSPNPHNSLNSQMSPNGKDTETSQKSHPCTNGSCGDASVANGSAAKDRKDHSSHANSGTSGGSAGSGVAAGSGGKAKHGKTSDSDEDYRADNENDSDYPSHHAKHSSPNAQNGSATDGTKNGKQRTGIRAHRGRTREAYMVRKLLRQRKKSLQLREKIYCMMFEMDNKGAREEKMNYGDNDETSLGSKGGNHYYCDLIEKGQVELPFAIYCYAPQLADRIEAELMYLLFFAQNGWLGQHLHGMEMNAMTVKDFVFFVKYHLLFNLSAFLTRVSIESNEARKMLQKFEKKNAIANKKEDAAGSRMKRLFPFLASGVSPILRDNRNASNVDLKLSPFMYDEHCVDSKLRDVNVEHELNFGLFFPSFLRPKPKFNLKYDLTELKWDYTDVVESKFLWDGTVHDGNVEAFALEHSKHVAAAAEAGIDAEMNLDGIGGVKLNFMELMHVATNRVLSQPQLDQMERQVRVLNDVSNYAAESDDNGSERGANELVAVLKLHFCDRFSNFFNKLVDFNPKVCQMLLKALNENVRNENGEESRDLIDEYLSQLIRGFETGTVTQARVVNSMELMKHVIKMMKFGSKEYVCRFVTVCIKLTESGTNMSLGSNGVNSSNSNGLGSFGSVINQNGLIRLLSVFIYNILCDDTSVVSLASIHSEIQHFAFENTRIKEASKLYQILRLKTQNEDRNEDRNKAENDSESNESYESDEKE